MKPEHVEAKPGLLLFVHASGSSATSRITHAADFGADGSRIAIAGNQSAAT